MVTDKETRTQRKIIPLFHETFPNVPPMSQGTIIKIEKQIHHFWLYKGDEKIKLYVMLEFEENPHTSSRQASTAFNVSHTSIANILKENKMHPYKMIPTQELMGDNFDRRTYFCERMINMLINNIIQLEDVMFSDVCTFPLNGHANRYNFRYWSTEIAHWMREEHTQYLKKVNVLAGISLVPFSMRTIRMAIIIWHYFKNDISLTLANLYPDPGSSQIPVNTM